MAITSQAGVNAGTVPPVPFVKISAGAIVAGWFYDYYNSTGNPPAGIFVNNGINGAIFTNTNSAFLKVNDAPAGMQAYLSRLQAQVARSNLGNTALEGMVLLYDRIWENSIFNVTSTAVQTLVTPPWPARDELGGTAGHGVYLGFGPQAGATQTPGSVTVNYTDSDGNAQVGDIIFPNTGMTNYIRDLITLAPTSRGVQSVQSFQFGQSMLGGGPASLIAFRPIALMEFNVPNRTQGLDAITGCLPKIWPGSCLTLGLFCNIAQGQGISGRAEFTYG